MQQDFYEAFSRALPGLQTRRDEPLCRHTSFRIGGPAAVMVFPKTEDELTAALRLCADLETVPAVLGAGTNVLAPDEGLPGVVISTRELNEIRMVGDCEIEAACGVTLARLAVFARDRGLTGLEFAHGIPGTVGGGMYMNAGAYGGELVQVAVSARFLSLTGEVREYHGEEMGLSYRHSAFMEQAGLIVSARFRLAALIQDAGLKGFRVGDAAVSEKHSGFVVNLGHATASDVQHLIAAVQEKVRERSGILLEPEVRLWKPEAR